MELNGNGKCVTPVRAEWQHIANLFHQSCLVVELPCGKCESQSGKHSAQKRKVRCPDVSCWLSHRMVQHFGTAVLI